MAAGTQLFSLALLYWIAETTSSATIMGLVLMAAALHGALPGPFAGTLADNVSRKHLIVWADVTRGLGSTWRIFLLPLINVNIISVMQGTTPSRIRGRVTGVAEFRGYLATDCTR